MLVFIIDWVFVAVHVKIWSTVRRSVWHRTAQTVRRTGLREEMGVN